ncbi:MAG: Bug family tripartite tricarboxylate transporter substrate binding protein [Burkholderiales bacterium]
MKVTCIDTLWTAAAVALGVTAGAAQAQTFPSKPLRIIVPFPAGGNSDLTSRMLGEPLNKALGQPVIVDNRPGAGAVIGYEIAAKAPPDGHTLLIVYPSFIINPSIRRVQYDPLRDFRPVTQLISLPMMIAVHPSLPLHTFKDFVALARARPGEITYGTPGVGTIQHVVGELIKQTTKINLTHVPYSGLAMARPALAGGHIVSVVGNVFDVAPVIQTGKVRAIVVTSPARTELLPNVPTMREVGFPEFETMNWGGFVVPAATPTAAVMRLNTELVRILKTQEIQDKFRAQGQSAVPSTPEQLASLLQSESTRYSKTIKAAGIRGE